MTQWAALLVLLLLSAGCRREGDIRAEILRMAAEDQDMRQELVKKSPPDPAFAVKVRELDRRNAARLKQLIVAHGWLNKSLVGEDGAKAAWLLVQHADQDRGFQKECLDLMEKAAEKGEASPTDLAYLKDRVLVGEGKKQIYGTQFVQVGGRLRAYPIEDAVHIDKRRAKAGLPPMAEYEKQLRAVYRSAQ